MGSSDAIGLVLEGISAVGCCWLQLGFWTFTFSFFLGFFKRKKKLFGRSRSVHAVGPVRYFDPRSVSNRYAIDGVFIIIIFLKKKIRFGTEKEERERERETQPAAAELVGFSVGFGRIVCEYFAFRHGDSNDGHSFHFYFNRKMRGKKGT